MPRLRPARKLRLEGAERRLLGLESLLCRLSLGPRHHPVSLSIDMKVQVKLFATLARSVPGPILAHYPKGIRPGAPLEVELPEGSTLADLVAQMGLPGEELKLTFVNGRSRELDYPLEPGDEIGFFPPVGGG